ncbi:MAG: hypothetical protein ACI9LX_000519 [Paraglaciecola sp.]
MKTFISFIIALFNVGHEFETLQCRDCATYTYHRFENAGSCQVGNILVSRRMNVDALQK